MKDIKVRELMLEIKHLKIKLDESRKINDTLVSKKIMALEVYNSRRPYFTILIACMFWILITASFSGIYVVVIASMGIGLLAVKLTLDYKYLEYLRTRYNLKVKSIKQSFNEVSENLQQTDLEAPPKPKNHNLKEIKSLLPEEK